MEKESSNPDQQALKYRCGRMNPRVFVTYQSCVCVLDITMTLTQSYHTSTPPYSQFPTTLQLHLIPTTLQPQLNPTILQTTCYSTLFLQHFNPTSILPPQLQLNISFN